MSNFDMHVCYVFPHINYIINYISSYVLSLQNNYTVLFINIHISTGTYYMHA